MATQQITKTVDEKINGAAFEELLEIFEGLENAGVYN